MKVVWTPITQALPHAKKVLLKTNKGTHFIHVMCDKNGVVVPWLCQDERWTDGKFDYADVTHWAEL